MNDDSWIYPQKEPCEENGDCLLFRAPAKINLSLLIGNKRPDGYHQVETIMTRISLYDEIRIEPALTGGIQLTCEGPCAVSPGKDNLVWKAALLFLKSTKMDLSLRIKLIKNIPVGAGLAGGSSDAAATLKAFNRMFQYPLSQQKLMTMAADLGSDVAFFIGPPVSFCTGRGEKVRKISKNPPQNYLIFMPDVSVSTKKVYENFQPNPIHFQHLQSLISGILAENTVDLGPDICANMLEESCFELFEELRYLKTRIEAMKLGTVLLSGSGSCFFCLLENNEQDIDHAWLEQASGCRCIKVVNNRW